MCIRDSKKAGISVYRDLSDDQVRELFSAYSNQDDAKTEYDFLLYRVLAQDPHLKAADGVPTPAQDAALVHRLASMQVLLEKASSASHEATSTLTASYATATLLAVQGRLRDLLTYRKELNMDALALIEEAICKSCLLYTSDAADEEDSVDLGGRHIIKKQKRTRRRMG
eukprot:TRINITY_DN22718_c0_g1_i1.p1 TRINITY_DN22718_c0_g1~~TRINITY_DN22718_c0_g1_i1.p1  ORF type:complete len:169 (+),score=23.96 TRINITY_DN22718_c0_g1_i1:125-631(+)